MVIASAITSPISFSVSSQSSISLSSYRHPSKFIVSSLNSSSSDSLLSGLSSKTGGFPLRFDEKDFRNANQSYITIEAKKGNPPIMPAVMTPGGPLDLQSVLFRNRIIFIGKPINSEVAQRVITQLVTLAAVDEKSDILIYLNCPGGSTYSVLAIYDCMSSIKPKVGTVCFGVAASQGALLLAGGEKGMRYAMPNARIMIHQPQGGCGGHVEDVRRQVNEAVQSRHKIDKMYTAFTGQPLEKVQQYTERDRFLSTSEAMEFGLIDGILETEY
ncbi:ATP-dependent Clp protease proteolytic subunit 6, chloroplastic [Mercurialis annua]|uniref:ATP-dependent Clp protease proteolytic subunit 6, chloroplastic n=1 Tax=Mercurialis annua TaxID=3986 RepID=UPI00215F5BB1|nr:ATP-dependent Clp protease proteolytic subunit 6, chloroplastic [Mercurialis annua]